jgi:hypothetical protein
MAACLKSFIYRFQEQPLLGIDCISFVGTDIEKCRVKNTNILVQEVRVANIGCPVSSTIVMIEAIWVESIGKDLPA